MSDRDYMVAGVIHELAVEIRKAMPKEDKKKCVDARLVPLIDDIKLEKEG